MFNNSGSLAIGKLMAATSCAAILSIAVLLTAGTTSAHAFTSWYATSGSHTVVLKPDGTVWALGRNNAGQLGNGKFGGQSDEPQQVKDLNNITAVTAKGSTSVALRQDGTVWAWGYNASGQLGNGTTGNSNVPVQVTGLKDVEAIAAGAAHVLALKKDGTVWAWGSNSSGQLGSEAPNEMIRTPIQVSSLHAITTIAAGAYHSAALQSDGSVLTWGSNSAGQLGIGTASRSATPVRVGGLTQIRAIAAGNYHVAALQQDGSVTAWGSNYYRQLGSSVDKQGSARPVQVSGISGVTDLTAKMNHTVAVMKDGSIWAWGDENAGQWGNGVSMDGSSVPVQVCGVNSFATVAAVGNPATALRSDGTAAARGRISPDRQEILAAGSNGTFRLVLAEASSLDQR